MAFTVGNYLLREARLQSKGLVMNVQNVVILEGQVAKSTKGGGVQLLQLEAALDAAGLSMPIRLYNASDDGTRAAEPYGSCCVTFEDPAAWRREWRGTEHLVLGQIESLEARAAQGKANKITRNMAYTLFKNVVDYAERYRGMRSVIIHGYEASAEVTLSEDEGGIWHTPPHWIDSVAHIAGLVMNGSDASNNADYFYVTPGWDSMRFIQPLEAGASYRNYVKMLPTEEKGTWTGDVYILKGQSMIGMVGQIKFRQYPRLLMDRFFSPNKAGYAAQAQSQPQSAPAAAAPAQPAQPKRVEPSEPPKSTPAPAPPRQETSKPEAVVPSAPEPADDNPMLAGVMDLIASETGLDPSELKDDTLFVSVGVDSLMSLVLVEKFKAQLNIDIKSSLFLECQTIAEFKEWLADNR